MLSEYGSPPTPSRIDRFEIINELGRGSQGVVYLARDSQLERNVAIKTINLNGANPGKKAQLLKEARTISRLQHPNILTLFEADEDNGNPYLVFEFVDGKSLRDFIQEKEKLSSVQALEIMLPLLDAVAYAHQRGIIHRDLTPSNILITPSNSPKIMDFGIADVLGRERESDTISGSIHYLSPEQCENKPALPTSDLFTLGLILIELLTGKRAINEENQFTIINKIVNEEIQITDTIEPAMQDVIRTVLEKDPNKRFQDAQDMKAALQEHLKKIKPEIDQLSSNDKDSTLQFLLRRMRHKKDFPTMPQQISEIAVKTDDRSVLSANMLANKILKNYSLSTKLLRLVNSPIYGQYGGRISTVSRAVVILGFKEVRMAAMGLMLFDHLENKEQSRMLKEASISSMMSGSIAKEMGEQLGIKDTEEAYICAMFHNFGRLLSMFYFPEEAQIISNRIKQKNEKESQASRAVLGLSYEELGMGVAKAWQLPVPIVRSMESINPAKIDKPRDNDDAVYQLANFSNELCEVIESSTEDSKEAALKNILNRYSKSIDLTPKQADKFLRKAVDGLEEYTKIFNLKLEDSTFIKHVNHWISGAKSEPEMEIQPEAIEDKLAPPENQSNTRRTDLLNSVQEISDSILDGASLNDIMVMVIETLYRGFDFNRVLFCLINRKDACVDARFGFGQDIDEILKNFKIPIRREPDIFNMALTKHKDFVIDNIDDKDVVDLIPDWYRQKMSAKSVIVYPIVVNKVPMGIIYADKSSPGQLSKNEQLSLIKTLRNQIVMAIRQNS